MPVFSVVIIRKRLPVNWSVLNARGAASRLYGRQKAARPAAKGIGSCPDLAHCYGCDAGQPSKLNAAETERSLFIPLHDANGLEHIKLQYVTIGLIAVNVIVFLLTSFGSQDFAIATTYGFGFVPSVAFDTVELPPELHFHPR